MTHQKHILQNFVKVKLFFLCKTVKRKGESHSVMFDSLPLHGLYSPWNSPDQNTTVGSQLFPSPGDLPNPGIKPDLLHGRRILYQLRHQGSPCKMVYFHFKKITTVGFKFKVMINQQKGIHFTKRFSTSNNYFSCGI